MEWNHRVVRFKDEDIKGGYRHEFKEVFYNDDGELTGYTDVFMWGEDVAEMQELGDRLLKASALPVLDESDFPSFDEDKTWQEESKAIEHLRALLGMGYAAVAFTPEELKGVDPDKVQDRLIELGHEVINDLEWTERNCSEEA